MSNRPEQRMAERARERVEERKRSERRRRRMYLAGGAVATLLILAALYLVATAPSEAPVPAEAHTRYDGIAQVTSDAGYPQLGSRDARANVLVSAAFTEPAAYAFFRDVYPALLERVRAGEISYAFAPLGIGTGRNPEGAARMALCAAEQGRFWQAHDMLFTWANDFGTGAFNTNRLRAGVAALGLDAAVFNDCFGQGRITDRLFAARQGATGAVTVRVNGAVVEATLDAINAAIDAFGPFTPLPEAPPEATPEAAVEDAAEGAPEATPAAEATPEATPAAEATPEAAP